jgi:hypothetical protein
MGYEGSILLEQGKAAKKALKPFALYVPSSSSAADDTALRQ